MKKQQTILIVEDEAEIREGIRILLSGESYTILEAENGEQALRKMSPQVDLVILDVMMPGISGLRVCEEIRKTSTVPILFLTAKAPGVGQAHRPDRRRGRLPGKALFLRGAHRPGEGPAAALLRVPGQRAARRHL